MLTLLILQSYFFTRDKRSEKKKIVESNAISTDVGNSDVEEVQPWSGPCQDVRTHPSLHNYQKRSLLLQIANSIGSFLDIPRVLWYYWFPLVNTSYCAINQTPQETLVKPADTYLNNNNNNSYFAHILQTAVFMPRKKRGAASGSASTQVSVSSMPPEDSGTPPAHEAEAEATEEQSTSQSSSNDSQELGRMSLDEKFKAAVKVIHNLPKDGPYQPSNGTKLKFYGLFKQATEGPCNVSKPGFWDVIGKYKWEAWNSMGQLSNEDAKLQYIESLKDIIETMSLDDNVQDFLNSIGPFYEFVVQEGSPMKQMLDRVGVLTNGDGDTSGSSSTSGSNSGLPSPTASSTSSPLKVMKEESEEEISVNGKVEVQITSRTATYETNHLQKNKEILENGDVGTMNHNTEPPPPPTHTYGRHGSISRNEEGDLDEEDEYLGVTLGNGNEVIPVQCKEDLEFEQSQGNGTSYNELPTSGTESEKYYSGDSEPEYDENPEPLSVHSNEPTACCSKSIIPSSLTTTTQLSSFSSNPSQISSLSQRKPETLTRNSNGKGRGKTANPGGAVAERSIGLNSFASSDDIILQSSLERMNRDIDHILARLRILEAAYGASVNGSGDVETGGGGNRRNRRLFRGLSYPTLTFIVLWPFAVHFLIKIMSWWWARRRRLLALPRRQ